MITTDKPRHLSSSAAYRQILAGGPIDDACAVTIAGWWQSPGAVGSAFAQLAQTGSVELTDLLADIVATRPEARRTGRSADVLAMDLLTKWAQSKA